MSQICSSKFVATNSSHPISMKFIMRPSLLRLCLVSNFIASVVAFSPPVFTKICTRLPSSAVHRFALPAIKNSRESYAVNFCNRASCLLKDKAGHDSTKGQFFLNAIGRGRGTPSEEQWKNSQAFVDDRRENPRAHLLHFPFIISGLRHVPRPVGCEWKACSG